jgi:hypothetical protein
MNRGREIESRSTDSSGRFLSRVLCLSFSFGLALGLRNELLAIPAHVRLNLLLLRRVDGSRLGSSITAASDEAGTPKRKDEKSATPPAARAINGRHAPVSLHQEMLLSY